MTVIGELAVNAVVRTEGAERGSRRFRDEISSMASAASRAGGAITALGVSTATAGFLLVRSQGEIADAADRAAQKLDIGVEALSRYRYAALIAADISDGQLDAALVRMNTNLGLAAQGLGKSRQSLDELGLSANRLIQLGTEDRIAAIAEALQKVARSSDRVRLAEKIFGTGELALLLENGRDGLKTLADESDRVGATFDTLANEKLGRADDALDRMHKSVGGLKHSLGGLLAPAVTQVADDITFFLNSFRAIPPVVDETTAMLALQAERTERLAQTRQRVIDQIREMDSAQGRSEGAKLQRVNEAELAELARDQEFLRDRIASLRSDNKTFGMSELDVARFNRTNNMTDKALEDELIRELELREKLEATRQNSLDLAEREKQMQERAASIVKQNLTPLEQLQNRLSEIQELQAAGKLTADQAIRAAENARKGFTPEAGASTPQRGPLAAIKFGSSEAQRAIAESRKSGANEIPAKQLKELQEANKLTQKLIDKIDATNFDLAEWET